MEKKVVYAVLYHSEWENYTPSSDIIGIFEKIEDARECMGKEIDYVLENSWEADEEATEQKVSDDCITLHDCLGGVDFVGVRVIEKEIK